MFDIMALNEDCLLDFPLKYRKKVLAQKLNIGSLDIEDTQDGGAV